MGARRRGRIPQAAQQSGTRRVLTVAMATGLIAGPMVVGWSKSRQEVGRGRPSPIGSSRRKMDKEKRKKKRKEE
jgi:hypothetical protein